MLLVHLTENPKSAGVKRRMACLKLSQINLSSTEAIKISGSCYSNGEAISTGADELKRKELTSLD